MMGTPSQTVGPFFRFGLDWLAEPDPGAATAIADDRAGPVPEVLEGRVLDGAGEGVPDALLELWADPFFARVLTGPDGSYRVRVVRPGPGRAGQAPHLDVSVFARGLLDRLVTRIHFPDEEEANRADPVLALVPEGRRATLVARPGDDGGLRFDVHLQGPQETVFFAY
jgi:protocatechuate 3,4-dioxygenase alpha subunit